MVKLILPILALVVALSAGCRAPRTEVGPQAPTWPAQIAASAETAAEQLDLAVMQRMVLANHPGIRAAQHELLAATARARGAGRWPNPELEGRVLSVDEGSADMEAALLFTLPLSGHRGAAGRVARLEEEIARINLAAARQEALRELDAVLVQLASAREGLFLREELATQSEQNAVLARERESASVADPLDVALVLADASQDRRAVLRSRNETAGLEAELRLLLGVAPGQRTLILPPLEPPRLEIDADTALGLALEHRSALRRARADTQRAEWEVVRAARQRFPDLLLGPAVTREDGSESFGLALGVSLPLFSTGGSAHGAARAARDAARERLAAAERTTAVDVRNRWAQFVNLQAEREALAGEANDAAGRALTLAQERYAAGQGDVLRLLSAHRAFASIKLEILDLVRAQWETLLDLEAAVGKPLRAGAAGRDER